MSQVMSEFSIQVEQIDGYEFKVKFDKDRYAELRLDEPPPLGKDVAPNPARILAAAIANCLSASLVFCLSRNGLKTEGLRTEARVQIVRNEQRRLRIGKVDVFLHPKVAAGTEALVKCLGRPLNPDDRPAAPTTGETPSADRGLGGPGELASTGGRGASPFLFEDFCTVTQSIRDGVNVEVHVEPEIAAG